MKKTLKIIGTTLKIILIVVVALIAIYDVCVVVQKYALKRDMPQFFGYSTAVVVSDSMYPEICKGDLVIIDVGAEYTVGDVITYYESSSGAYITHRVITVNADGSCITQGDNNNSPDAQAVTQEMAFGKVVGVLGGVGGFITYLQQPIGLILVLVVAVLIWVVISLLSRLASTKKEE